MFSILFLVINERFSHFVKLFERNNYKLVKEEKRRTLTKKREYLYGSHQISVSIPPIFFRSTFFSFFFLICRSTKKNHFTARGKLNGNLFFSINQQNIK